MDDLNEILKSAAASPRHTLDPTTLENRIRSRRRRRGIVRVTAVALLVVVGLAALEVAAAEDHENVIPTVTTVVPPATTLPTPATSLPASTTSVPAAVSTVPST